MLGKLYKHEFYAQYRIVILLYAVMAVFVGITCLTGLFASNPVLSFIQNISIFFTGISLIACVVVSFVLVILRFYRSFLSGEAYLTLTLPVKASAQLICKLVCGCCVMVTSVAAVLGAVALLLWGSGASREVAAFFHAMGRFITENLGWDPALTLAITAGVILLLMACGLMSFYTAMAIGQRMRSKVAGSVIAYICVYMVQQFVAAAAFSPWMLSNQELMGTHLNTLADLKGMMDSFILPLLLMMLGLNLVLFVAEYLVANHMLSKKLNLE